MKRYSMIWVMILSLVLLACNSESDSKSSKDDDNEPDHEEMQRPGNKGGSFGTTEKYTGDSVLLRYKFTQGEEVKYNFNMNIDMDLGSYGSMEMDISFNGNYVIDTIYPNGNAIAMMLIEKAEIEASVPGGISVSYDSDNPNDRRNPEYYEMNQLVDEPTPVMVTPIGEVGDMSLNPHSKALAAASSLYGNEQFQSLIEGSFHQLPVKPVVDGMVYDAGTLSSVSSIGMDLDFDASYRVKSISKDAKMVILEPLGEVTSDVIEEMDFEGEVYFDVERGNIDHSRGTVDMKLFIEGVRAKAKATVKYDAVF